MSATRLLLTGIGGFIGHHVAEWILDRTDWEIVGLDSWQYRLRGDTLRIGTKLLKYATDGRLKLHSVDLAHPISPTMENQILERQLVKGATTELPIDYIINLASDSHVTRSIHDPSSCWLNNCSLILHMLEFARRVRPKRFIHISTDEVYGELPWTAECGHKEWDTVVPSNPYSASKAAQEALAISYWRTYGVPLMITNTTNVIGERQDPEKFVPLVIQKILHGETVQIHADGDGRIARRVLMDAKNMADALLFLLRSVEKIPMYADGHDLRPERVHICGDQEFSVLEVAQMIAQMLGMPLKHELVRGDTVRPGYDRRYALDGQKLRDMGWRQPYSLPQTFRRVSQWALSNPRWLIRP